MLGCIPTCFRSERTVVDGASLASHSKASRNVPRQASDYTSIDDEMSTQGSGRLLCAVQRDICAIQSKGLECRASAVVELFLKAIGASAVRLYGVSDEQPSSGTAMLVLLAAGGRPGPGALADPLPGCALELPTGNSGGLGLARYNLREFPDGATSLLQRVISTKEPAAFRVSHVTANKPIRAAAVPSAAFVALPLLCASRTLGVIWVAADESAGPAAHHLLTHPMSQQQLSISVSSVLAGCAGGGAGNGSASGGSICGVELPYTCWLAGAVHRLAAAATLHALVAELTATIEGHVRRSYLVDVAVHVALVPSASSNVAYFLTQETPSTAVQPTTGIICSTTAPRIRRIVSASRSMETLLTRPQQSSPSGSIARNRQEWGPATPGPSPLAAPASVGTGTAPPGAFAAVSGTSTPAPTTATTNGAKASKSKPLNSGGMEHLWSSGRSLGRNSSTGAASAGGGGGGGGGSGTSQSVATVQPPKASLLRAKAFKVSNTLIQRMMEAAGSGSGSDGTYSEDLPAGLVVASCSRWVADVRRPCRDVCYMMTGGAGANPITVLGPIPAPPAGGNMSCGAQSLVLLGIAVNGGGEGDGSAGANDVFLGLYLAFPSLLPPLLLEAVRNSCRGLLQWPLARVVRHKLLDSLASEVGALRAGVPGSYAVVVLPAVQTPAPVMDTSASSVVAGGSSGNVILGTIASAPPPSREREREHLGSFQLSAVPGSNANPNVLAGEVLPPGRLARTVTQHHTTKRTQAFLSDQCPFEEGLDPLAAVNNTVTTNATNTLTMFGTVGGSERAMGGGMELVSDLELTVELTGRGSCAVPTIITGPIPTANGSSARQHQTAAGAAPVVPASAALAASETPCGASAGQPSPNARGPPVSTNSAFTTNGASVSGWHTLMNVLPRSMKRAHTAPGHPHRSGQQLQVGASGGSTFQLLGSPQAACGPGSSVLVRELLPALCEGSDADGSDVTSPADVATTPPAAVLTVQEADVDVGQRAHLGLLVESLLGSMRSAYGMDTMQTTNTSPYEAISTRPSSTIGANAEDLLDELQLYDILGEGASGVVLRGLLGTVPVAVKLIEMPRLDDNTSLSRELSLSEARMTAGEGHNPATHASPATTTSTGAAPDAAKAPPNTTAAGGGDGGGSSQVASRVDSPNRGVQVDAIRRLSIGYDPRLTREQVAARRCFYRNAMELAVLRSTTHVNIVQCLGVYDNVLLEHVGSVGGHRFCMLRRCRGPDMPKDSPICTAIITELCDSSLGAALAERCFPTPVMHAATGVGRSGGSGPHKYDMRGVYLTVLEVALALRHLHARRLVHRDIKPANILLKASHSDPRGWTTKLADFGFALMLDRQDSQAECSVGATNRTGSSFGMFVSSCGGPATAGEAQAAGGAARLLNSGIPSSSVTGGGSRTGGGGGFYTVQEQACGTVTHMAPEAMRANTRIDASVDIFALGVIMWELVAGRGHRPYKHLHPDSIPSAVSGGMRPLFPDWVPLAYRRLAISCWTSEPHRRPSAADVVLSVKAQMESLGSMQAHSKSQMAGHAHRQQGAAAMGDVRGA